MAKLLGLSKVLANLNKQARAIETRTQAGLLTAGIVVRAQAMRNTPVKTGNLVGSSFGPRPFKRGSEQGVVIGYTANYAVVVHERVVGAMGPVKAKEGQKGPKYLERALQTKGAEVLNILQKHARIR